MTETRPLFEEMAGRVSGRTTRNSPAASMTVLPTAMPPSFFANWFLLLDVYANYAKRIPQAVSETNQSTLVSLKKVREEIGLLAQTVENPPA